MKRYIARFLALLFAIELLSGAAVCVGEPAAPPEGTRLVLTEPERPLTEEEKRSLLSALYEADIASLRRAIDLRLITCRELTEYYLDRIEKYNEEYNCFITLCDDALAQAELRDRQLASGAAQGALFGIPVVVKDNIHVAGHLTTNGYKKEDSAVSVENAAIVDNMIAQGAVILGKTNMSTGAQDAFTSRSAAVGETKNAYSVYLSAGGSSGGSATAVSLNFAAAALGTDTNSSLRIPAAWGGCVTLRVTRGLLDRSGIEKLNNQRDVPGAITRSVEDQAIMLDVLSGGSYRENLDADALNGLRIGILTELVQPCPEVERRTERNISPEVMAAFDRAVEELRACGAEVVEVSMPDIFALSEVTFPVGGYKEIPRFTAAFKAFLAENELSAVIFPSCLSAPLRTGADENGVEWSVYAQPFLNNCRTLSPCAAVPEITVPIGQHSLGAGIGMEIAAEPNSEQLLLDIAYSYTLRYDHRPIPTGAPDDYAGANTGDLRTFIDSYEASLLLPPVEESAPDEAVGEENVLENAPEEQSPGLTEKVPEENTEDETEITLREGVAPCLAVIGGIGMLAAAVAAAAVYRRNCRGGKRIAGAKKSGERHCD